MDGEQLDVEEGFFDAVICRLGFMYFPEQQPAFAGMRRALKPGGRLAGVVFSTPEANGFFSIPVSIIRRRAALPAPLPGQMLAGLGEPEREEAWSEIEQELSQFETHDGFEVPAS